MKKHASDSTEQQILEAEILVELRKRFGVELGDKPDISQRVSLDGFEYGEKPICVEIWARQGKPKPGQVGKVMKDFCKMLLVEKLLGKPCRKLFVVSDPACISFLENSWQGRFAAEYGVELLIVDVDESIRASVREAQVRQRR